MDFFLRYRNKPRYMYCPKFLLGEFSPLSLSYDSKQFYFSHQEPNHIFIASLKNKFLISFKKFPDDINKWLYCLTLFLSPFSSVQIQSNNKFRANFTTPQDDLQVQVEDNSLLISKRLYFDLFFSYFSFTIANPMIFEAQFSDGPFTFGCKASSNSNSTNMFYQIWEGRHFSYIISVICSSISLSKFVFSNTLSLKYPRFVVSTSFEVSEGYLVLSSGFKYHNNKFKFGTFGQYQSNNSSDYSVRPAVGMKYNFSDSFASSFAVDLNFLKIGAELKHKNNIMKPSLKLKFNEPAFGFGFSFISKD